MLDKPLRPPPRRRDKTAGQALTEATLMLSLLAFTWMAAGYMTFKTQNGIRTAMGARHGAWMRAHGTDPSGGQTEDDFFAHTGIASLNAQNSETVTLPGEFAALAASAAGPAYQVENVEVGFNVLAKVGSREHPYVGLTMQPPFMPISCRLSTSTGLDERAQKTSIMRARLWSPSVRSVITVTRRSPVFSTASSCGGS